jgi:phosphopantetheinyl transferase
LAALSVVGVSDFHQNAPHFWKVLNMDLRNDSGARLAFAWMSAEEIEPILAQHPGTCIAIHIAPTGVMIAGKLEDLNQIAEILGEKQLLFQIFPYPPIHTPWLSHLRDELLDHLKDKSFEIRQPHTDLYSSITADKYPHDDPGIRETLLLNIDHPLRIWQTFRRMYNDGARIFVQVGGGHMAGHMPSLLEDGAQIVTAPLDVDTRNPLTQLNHLCATLLTAGVPFVLDPLFENRTLRQLDLDAPAATAPAAKLTVPLRIDWNPLYSDKVPAKGTAPAATISVTAQSVIAASLSPKSVNGEPTLSESPASAEPATVDAGIAGTLSVLSNADLTLPVLGRITHFEPHQKVVIERRLDLNEDLFLRDHLFVHAPCKPYQERLPILPLTMSMEFMAESASLLAPGKTLIGFENVRGRRWIGLDEALDGALRVEVVRRSVDGDTSVERFDGTMYFEDRPSFSATVLLADNYREDLTLDIADSSKDGPWPFTTEQVYTERFMFHGPAFHVLAGLYTLGNPGASGALKVLPKSRLFGKLSEPRLLTDPCLMDGIGQIVGLWTYAHDQTVLPIGVDRVELYRSTPPVGTIVTVRMEVLEFNLDIRQFRCNIEIEDGEGYVWARVAGWTEWIMGWSKKYLDFTRLPNHFLVGDEITLPHLPEVSIALLVTADDLRNIQLEWAARFGLHAREMPEFFALPDNKKKQQMIFSRVAAKDAIRLWWSRQYETSIPHPAEFSIAHDELGRPYLEPAGDSWLPHISIAHTEGAAVALASTVPVGIDIEPAIRDVAAVAPEIARAEEMSLIEDLASFQPDEGWWTRLWCAKEAAAKALGTGLQGRPKDFQALDGDPQGNLLILHVPGGERIVVHTARFHEWTIAYAALPQLSTAVTAHEALALGSPSVR